MAHFARINGDNVVVQIIVADQSFIDSGAVGSPSEWVQYSYNTRGNVHYDPTTNEPDGGIPLRKNAAGVGFRYDGERDAFIPPKPFDSWILDEDTCLWSSPIAYPNDGQYYIWNETNQSWDLP